MNLRDIVEIAPLLIQQWSPDSGTLPDKAARINSLFYLLLRAWERELDRVIHDQPFQQAQLFLLAEEIICSELLTVSVSGLLLGCSSLDLTDQLSTDLRSHAADHGVLRNQILERAEVSARQLADLLRIQRLRRRLAGWIDLVLEPVVQLAGSVTDHDVFVLAKPWQTAGRARTCLMMTGLQKAIPQRRVRDPYRSALLGDLISEALSQCHPETFRH